MIPTEWIMGLIGGLMIGTAAAVFLLGNGRIMGASGLIGGLIDKSGWSDWAERLVFLVAVITVPAILIPLFNIEVSTNATSNVVILILGGLLVGLGTRLANGCTSGHGVCGISRFSLRGIMATVFYLVAGFATMLIFRHLMGVI
ncbi:MAG: YeeE/YedE family protein [Nitrincola sp.]|nr:YeeE/YedE family protein [Nitrincola sp.]